MKGILAIFFFGSLTLSAQDPCSTLERKVDDFTDNITISSPLAGYIGSTLYFRPAAIFKRITKNGTTYSLLLRAYSDQYEPLKTGVYIIFSDGSKFSELKTRIEVKDHKRGYEYKALIPLSQTDLQNFSTKQIQRFRLFAFEGEIDAEDSQALLTAAKCLGEAK